MRGADVRAPSRPANQPGDHEESTLRGVTFATLWGPSILLAVSALVMAYAYLGTDVLAGNRGLTNLTESYGALERVALWQHALQWLPGADGDGGFFTLAPDVIAWTVRVAFVGMFAAQAWAFRLAWRSNTGTIWPWLAGPVAGHVAMLLFVPSNADVFFYEMTGDLAATGYNPYVWPLMAFPEHPLLGLNHWVEMTAVYGPVWTAVNAGIMAITGPDPVAATLAYKVVLGAVALALAWVVYRFTLMLTGSSRLAVAAGVLVAWQPNMLVESSGQAHNDPLLLLLSTLGIWLAIAGGVRAIRGGLVLVTLSAMVKYVTLPVLGLLGLVRIVQRRRPNGWFGILGSWVLDGIAIAAVIVAAFAPFWAGTGTLTEMFSEPGRLYTNPIWFDTYMLLDLLFPHEVARSFADVTRTGLQLATLAIFVVATIRFVRQLWAIDGDSPDARGIPAWAGPFIVVWAVVLATLALLPANSHPWYWTWPVVPIAVLVAWEARDDSHTVPPRWLWWYLGLTALMTLAYHTRIVHL